MHKQVDASLLGAHVLRSSSTLALGLVACPGMQHGGELTRTACCVRTQVLDSSLEAHVLRSDSSSLAKDCRKEIKALNAQLLKLGPRWAYGAGAGCVHPVVP